MLHGRARVYGRDGEGIGRVKRDGGKSSWWPGSGSERLEGIKGLAEAGHTPTLVSHALQGVQEGLTDLTSKSGGPARPAGQRQVEGWVAPSRMLRRGERSCEGARSVRCTTKS
uniref:Uncharacterized protein n=1 Tax=Setaria viridis TaxID=4556 RepID=A0A4U6TIK8_SETVI|nr:hypothetical protein SEVIR_8G232900v2 [Setaria viridis]